MISVNKTCNLAKNNLLEHSFRYSNGTKILIFVGFFFKFVKSFVLEFEPGMNQQLMFSVYDIDSRYVLSLSLSLKSI